MAKNNNRNNNGGNTNKSNITCNNCKKTGHYAKDCRSGNNQQNKNQNQNQNNKGGKHCSHCNKNGHNYAECNKRKAGNNNQQNGAKRCTNCNMNNHTTEECSKTKQTAGQSTTQQSNGIEAYTGTAQTLSRPCTYCGANHLDASCNYSTQNQVQFVENPEHHRFNATIPNSTNFAQQQYIQPNPFANDTCQHCSDKGHPTTRCPRVTQQAQINTLQYGQQAFYSAHQPQSYAPVQTQGHWQQSVYVNPLMRSADDIQQPLSQLSISQNGHNQSQGSMFDRDGDIVMDCMVYGQGYSTMGEDLDDDYEF